MIKPLQALIIVLLIHPIDAFSQNNTTNGTASIRQQKSDTPLLKIENTARYYLGDYTGKDTTNSKTDPFNAIYKIKIALENGNCTVKFKGTPLLSKIIFGNNKYAHQIIRLNLAPTYGYEHLMYTWTKIYGAGEGNNRLDLRFYKNNDELSFHAILRGGIHMTVPGVYDSTLKTYSFESENRFLKTSK
jgi:hypothetical protein